MPRIANQPWLAAVVATLALVPALAAQPGPQKPAAVLISLDGTRQPVVRAVDLATLRKPSTVAGLLVWANEGSQERWQLIARGWTLPEVQAPAPDSGAALGGTRSVGGDLGGPSDGAGLTVVLDQIHGGGMTRAIDRFLTPPADGIVLSSRPTFRRLPKDGKYPEDFAVLAAVGKPKSESIRIPFKEGQAVVAFGDIPNLPPSMAAGLAPGKYHLAAGSAMYFTVEATERSARVRRPLDELAHVLGNRTDPLYLTFAVEHLLARTDPETGTPLYLTDAFDMLDAVPEKTLDAYQQDQRKQLVKWLRTPRSQHQKPPRPPAPGEDTGIKNIDAARAEIAAAQWFKAQDLLKDSLADKANARARGLAAVYLGVVFAELGTGNEEEALRSFRQGIALLKDGAPADLLRAHNNLAGFFQHQAQDGLYNHSLQLAAGVERPFLTALQNWIAAREHYQTAGRLAAKLGRAKDRAAVQVNLARLYALLADIVRSLGRERRFEEGEKAAARQADRLAARAAKTSEPLVRALAAEVRAHLALRAGDKAAARTHALETRAGLLAVGNLAGVENVERVLALTAASPAEALKHYQVAFLINESLRERLPPDGVGHTQAAFFARKAWVNEKIVELLLTEQRYDEALRHNELGRARALQDLLLADHGRTDTATDDTSAGDFLTDWPRSRKVAAVEYFLGASHAWVFVVSVDGKVAAYQLKGADDQPLETAELVGRVHRFLQGIEGQAGKMFNRVMAKKGFDHAWQDDLYRLCNELLPEPVRTELGRAEVAVIVPQHILHYFPFAALVTRKDPNPDPEAMIKPRHLLDEKYTIVYAPSLTTWSVLRNKAAPAAGKVHAVGLVQAPDADPLPGVDEDLKNLREIFHDRLGTVEEGARATEENALKLFDRSGLVFLATHGLNDADRPLDSFLFLLPPGNKGQLTARKIFEQKVKADLLVMSACYSGLGDRSPQPGDDLFGLQRAFLQSGARTVVSGLWDVYDGSAPELMKGFFQGLVKGQTAPQALAESQRAFVNRLRASSGVEPWLHPYFWAVYTAAGDHRTALRK